MTLRYWIADHKEDSKAYSIRTRTRREAVEQVGGDHKRYGKPRKVEIGYKNAFDLMLTLTGESNPESAGRTLDAEDEDEDE